MKKYNKYRLLVILTLMVGLGSCSDFLDVDPQAVISDVELSSAENIDALIISAYAMLGNDHYTVPNQLWPYGDLRAGDAYKGGDGPADISIYHAMEVFSTLQPDMSAYAPSVLGDINNKKWERQYTAISRVNNALGRLNNISVEEYALKNTRAGELRFLRGHYYFDLKILYKYVPWITEGLTPDEIVQISNTALSNDELWNKIVEEFRFAVENLPVEQDDIGRPNKNTAKAYLAKSLIYQAYEQNETHEVVNINSSKLQEVSDLVDEIIASNKYDLEFDFANPFLWEFENGNEAVWQIQRSHDDGTTTGNLDFSSMLNNPMSEEFGCCWFHIPSQNLVNSFKTNNQGLPYLDNFNQEDLDLNSDTVDPRLDHTVAQPNKPWKYETELIYETEEWARQPGIYGPYSSLKENVSPFCECFEQIPPFMSSSKNTILIRYSDVLLWKAEALIELGKISEGIEIINQIRQRAANSTALLEYADGTPLSNYNVQTYPTGLSKTEAVKALRYERRIELALEGIRFFDLVRWGIASESLNGYFSEERGKREYLNEASFVNGKHEYLPIPQQQINLSNGFYTQNNGY